MSRRDPADDVRAVLESCGRISRATAGVTRERFFDDEVRQDAVERRLIIIGDAATRLRTYAPAIARELGNMPSIIALRDSLMDECPSIDPVVLWDVIRNDVPALKLAAAACWQGLQPHAIPLCPDTDRPSTPGQGGLFDE
jgi:uncharacterized protein with HEPN domain